MNGRTSLRMVTGLLVGLLSVAACSESPVVVAPVGAVDLALPWAVDTPESVGINAEQLGAAGDLAGDIGRVRSLLVARGGRLVLERYYGGSTWDSLADVRSVTKSIVSTLTGIAIDQGHISSIDQPIAAFLDGPEFHVRVEHHLVTVRHLLSMTGGFDWGESGALGYDDWILSDDRIAYILDRDVIHTPGSTFGYNSAAVFLLGIVVEKAVERPLTEYADEVLFGPLGILERGWEELSEGYVNGASGIDLRPRDLARIGQLYLQEGWSGDRSVLPGPWVDEATTRRFSWTVPDGPIQRVTYGFLWWIDLDNGAYFAMGYGGQFLYVVPRLDLVVVATTDWHGVHLDIGAAALQEAVLNIIVNDVLPAVS